MEEQEKKHIVRNLTELVNNTKWNTDCLTVPIATGVFGDADCSFLESIPDKRMRVIEFYRVFMTKYNSYQHLIATLQAGCQSGAVKILRESSPTKYFSLSEQQISSCSSRETDKVAEAIRQPVAGSSRGRNTLSTQFDVIQPVRLFTGRIKELEDIHKKLQHGRTNPTVISQMASIVGLGGIGKTELARMYIHKYAERYDNNLIWISAETEETLTGSFRRLATDYLKITLLNVDGKEKHMKSIIKEVYQFFVGKQCLFVFDNAESNEGIKAFLPLQVRDPPYTLITSRDRDWKFSVEMVELNEMEEQEAIDFVKIGLQVQNAKQDKFVVQLVKTLQCFPLALSQAISYIKQQQIIKAYSICEYLQEYESGSENLLNYRLPSGELSSYTKTTFTTWKMSMELLARNGDCGIVAIRMLNMIAYLEPDKIPIALLQITCNNERISPSSSRISQPLHNVKRIFKTSNIASTQEETEKPLKLLVKNSMVNIQPTEQTISIHRLVQEVTRIELRRNEQEEATLKQALRLLSGNLKLTCTCINHFCNIYKYCNVYKTLVLDFKDVPWRILQELSIDSTSIRYYSGVSVGNELKETLQKHVSLEDVDVVKLKYGIAMANYRAGNYEAAIKTLNQILPTYLENKAGLFTKTEILNVQCFLSICLKESGKRSESLKTMLQTYKSSKVVYGLNDWWTIQALVETANCLRELGHFNKPFVENAEYLQGLNQDLSVLEPLEIVSLLKAAYENNKHVISNDSNYSRCMFLIAWFFYDIGDRDTASTIANDVYELGRNSNDTKIQVEAMSCLNLLGIMKSDEGKHEDALEIYKEVHTFSSKMLGSSHLSTLTHKSNMLLALCGLGQLEAALVGFHEVLETLMKNFPNHPHVFWSEFNIGVTLFKLKWHEKSLALLVNLRTRIEDRFGLTYPLLSDVTDWIEKVKKFVVNEDLNK